MILITGWTGNTGSIVLKQLLQKYSPDQIVGITRNTADTDNFGITIENANLSNEKAVRAIFAKYQFDTIIHIANIRYSPLLMSLADMHKVPRIILVHTTGIYSKYREYSELYKEIEDKMLNQEYQNTSYTILRPTMIYGNKRDHNMNRLIRFLARSPIFPVFGDGSAVMQPVHVEDLADAILKCLDCDVVKNRDYDLSGGTVVTYKEILNTITRLLKRRVVFIHIPLKIAILLVKVYRTFFSYPRITVEQVQRLQEDKSYPHTKAISDLDFNPRSFEEGITQEVNELRKEGLV